MRYAWVAGMVALVHLAGCGGQLRGGDGGQICQAPCTENGHCEFRNACRNGCCTPGCDNDGDCLAGEVCRLDRCVTLSPGTDGGSPAIDGGSRPDGGPRPDGGAADGGVDGGAGADGGPAGGAVGAACSGPGDCADGTCLALPGGYCTRTNCTQLGCPAGSECFMLQGGSSACFKTCSAPTECRQAEGYTCDSDNTCYPAPAGGDGGTGGSPIGAACSSNASCGGGAVCYPETSQGTPTGFVQGYCVKFDCAQSGCPSGSACYTVSTSGTTACLATCTADGNCRAGYDCVAVQQGAPSACLPGCAGPSDCPQGYACDTAEGICVPPSAQCSPQNPTGPCPAGQVCSGGTCQPFTCSDTRFEPNESQAAAATAPDGTTTGIALCAGDRDWYKMAVPAKRIATLGITFQHSSGDLDLAAYTSGGTCLGGRYLQYCSWTDRSYETNEEFLSVLNGAASGEKTFGWRVQGAGGATNLYSLVTELIPWTDGRDCTPTYPQDECEGRPGGRLDLIQFPFPDPGDGYVGDGYRFDSLANYRWLRRETIMLVRYAIRSVQQKFAGTKPLGLIDMCQRDGITPGYDINDPRHPESTHDQGGNIDIAYYTTLASSGTLAYNEARIICDANEGNHNGSFCNPSAAQTHVVDLPRQVYFMAKLFESPRLRVIGVDQVIAPLLQQEAARQFQAGDITQAQRDAFSSKMAYGSGWPFHHHHIHLSMKWWGTAKPGAEPLEGCGFDLVRHRVRDKGVLPSLR